SGKTFTIRASNERLVNSSNKGLNWSRRNASRASPASAFPNMSWNSCRSSMSKRCNLLARPGAECCSRSSADKIAASNSGLINSRQSSRSLHNPFFFRGRQLGQDQHQPFLLIGDQFRKRESNMRCLQLWKMFQQIVAHENKLKRQLGMQLLIPSSDVFDRRDQRLQLFFRRL